MRKILLTTVALFLVLGASSADAATLGESRASHASSGHRHTNFDDRASPATAATERRAAYSARAFDGAAHAYDPAFSPQQDEIYDGRF